MKVRVIQAALSASADAAARLRVAAYCRVSTDMEEQESSYEAQCAHYSSYISSHPGWAPAGIYADEGISGTSTRGRAQFHDMIRACEAGRIDLILTKSISRFARNTLDCLSHIRRLRELGIAVYFEKENINTMDSGGELLLTILAGIAQQESQSISQNVRMGIQYRMQEGVVRLDTTKFLGLTKAEGKLVIVPEEADTVRRIYREYLEGFSPGRIAARLEADGVPSPAHGVRWYPSTVASILKNEKYCGDTLLQKYYVKDFLTHRVVKNTGRFPQYYVENHHEPIVPKAIYYQAQGELARRAALKGEQVRCGSAMAFVGRLICGKCARPLRRITGRNDREPDWRCRCRAGKEKRAHREAVSACGCRFVPESQAQKAAVLALNRAPAYRDALSEELRRLGDALRQPGEGTSAPESAALERAELCRRETQIRLLLELIDELTHPGNASGGAAAEPPACYDEEAFYRRTRRPLPAELLDSAGRLAGFDNDLVIRCLSRLTVTDEGFEAGFKAGISVFVALEEL